MFRFPPHLNLFCAVVGTGTQILVLAFAIFGLSLLGTYHPYNRGALLTSCVVLYALTAGGWRARGQQRVGQHGGLQSLAPLARLSQAQPAALCCQGPVA